MHGIYYLKERERERDKSFYRRVMCLFCCVSSPHRRESNSSSYIRLFLPISCIHELLNQPLKYLLIRNQKYTETKNAVNF